MYRYEIYLRRLQAELKSIMQSKHRDMLTISPVNNPYYYPANYIMGFTKQIVNQLVNKKEKSRQEYVYLLVGLKILGENHLRLLAEGREKYERFQGNQQAVEHMVEQIEKMVKKQNTTIGKDKIRYQYEKALGRAQVEGYFRIPQVPVFLIATNWLQKLFSTDLTPPGPINNKILLQPSEFPINDNKYAHFNYRVRSDVRERQDFQVIPYEAWKLLYETYGGTEVRRFTTREKQPTVQIWYVRTNIWIVEERAVLIRLELLVGKNETIEQILQRLKITLKKYQVIPDSFLARQPSVFKVSGLQPDQFTAILHSQEQLKLLTQRMQRIKNKSIQFDQTSIFSSRQALVFNYNKSSSSIFDRVPAMKVIQLRQKCLRCGATQGIQLCKCRSAYFCSKMCRDGHKEHLKECDSLQGEARKYALVTDCYDVKKKCYPKLENLISLGKVGFQNLGNTCYMNSALQCILRIQPISRYFLVNEHLKDLNVNNVLGSEGYLACAYGQLVKSYYTTARRALQPTGVLRVIARNPQFRGYNHQDSQEFLNYFLDKLHEDLNRVRTKPYTEEIQSKGRPDQVVSQESWDTYLQRNSSHIVDNLAGQYRSEIRCPDCQRLSITFDPFLSLTLQFPRPEKGMELKGWIMTEEGEFQSFEIEVKSAMPTHLFYSQFFHNPVHGVYQSEKRIANVWDPNSTVFQNVKNKGVLFFYEKPHGHSIQLRFQFNSPDKNGGGQNFIRIAFAKSVQSQAQLLKLALLAIRRPVQKALGKDYNTEDYIALNDQFSFLKVRGVASGSQKECVYPVVGADLLTVSLELDQSKLKLKSQMKLNSGSAIYNGRCDSLVRKVGKRITMPQLLACFSQPQKLTQENAWYCSVCKDHKLADKAMQLYRTPKFLIVHLKRFNHRGDSGNRYIIYGQKVSTPIDLQQFQTIKDKKYQLIGLVNHVGSLMHGHYTAAVKRGEWYNYDDSRCSRTQLDGRNAYLLFYQLVEQN